MAVVPPPLRVRLARAVAPPTGPLKVVSPLVVTVRPPLPSREDWKVTGPVPALFTTGPLRKVGESKVSGPPAVVVMAPPSVTVSAVVTDTLAALTFVRLTESLPAPPIKTRLPERLVPLTVRVSLPP